MTTFPMPRPGGVARLLSMLFARSVEAARGKPVEPGTRSPVIAGSYHDDEGRIRAVCVLDFPLAAYTGAALTMIPPGTAEESIRSGKLSESIEDNLAEVLNVCVGFFSNESTPPIRLAQIRRDEELPAEMADLVEAGARQVDLSIEIAGYGEGTLTLLAA